MNNHVTISLQFNTGIIVGDIAEPRNYELPHNVVSVISHHPITSHGTITKWRFWASNMASFQALVFRPHPRGNQNRWTVIGINDVPATDVKINKMSNHDVEVSYQITVQPGDVIGLVTWGANDPEIHRGYDDTGRTRFSRISNGTLPLEIGKTYPINHGPSNMAISLSAELSTPGT